MKFHILSLFPEFFDSCLKAGLLGKAVKNSLIDIEIIDIKSWTEKGRADDQLFGGGDGMLLRYSVLESALKSVKRPGHIIYLSPQGEKWSAAKAKEYSKKYSHLTLLCGRYAGVDSRFVKDFAHEELSIGDYVLNGGESAALVIIESLSRFVSGFLGNQESSQKESFENSLLEGPAWTRPRHIRGHQIPEVFFSGHHAKIQQFRFYTSLLLTWLKRPDILEGESSLLSKIPEAKAFLSRLPDKELEALGLCKKDGVLILSKK